MKPLSALFVIFFLINIPIHSQNQTDAGIPDVNHVLVVWNGNSTVSDSVMQYYVNARNIPGLNIVRLDSLVRKEITIDGVTHPVKIAQETDIIRDSTNHAIVAVNPTFHAWRYFYDRIATPIKQHLETTIVNGTPLKESIRYLVLCKGVPYKLQSRFDWPGTGGLLPHNNVSLQSLLSIIGNDNYNDLLLSLFNGAPIYDNPYSDVYWMTMDYRFLPNHFTNQYGLKLSYLISRLDGLSYEKVVQMIDNAVNADMTGTKTWVLDSHPGELSPSPLLKETLECLECEVNWDATSTPILDNTLFGNNEVMGYSSAGTHAGMDPDYITNSLEFTYARGAVFNTFESFNGNSFGEI